MALPTRKSARLKNYDYSQSGAYFITICTADRRCILSRIVDARAVGALHEAPAVELTRYGRIADQLIGTLPERYGITVEKYVIMPNHIHLLIFVNDAANVRAIRESPLQSRSLVSKIVGYLKMTVSKEIHRISPGMSVWQRSYYDHVVRDENDFLEIWNYIEGNPSKWNSDRFFSGE